MFIAREAGRSAPFGGAEWLSSGEALFEFRSSERSRYSGVTLQPINITLLME